MKKLTNYFSVKRFLKTISTDLLSNAQNISLAAGSLCAVLIFILSYYASIDEANHYWPGIYSAVFLFAGLVVTGMLFGELSNKSRSFFYLLIPASIIEKFLSKIIIALVLFPLVMVCLFYVVSEVAGFLATITFESEVNTFYPLNEEFLKGVKFFYIFSPMFIFGSVYFHGQSLLKTIVSIGLITITLYVILAIEWKMLFWDYSNFLSISLSKEYMFTQATSKKIYPLLVYTTVFFSIFIKYLFAPFFLILSYIAFKEREV